MMNRILKRPMFRMGGRSDDGIMSLRPGYQEGNQVTKPGFFTRIFDAINPPSGKVLERIQKRQKEPSIGEVLFSPSDAPLEFRTQAEADKFLEANPDFINPIKILDTGALINQKTEQPKTETDTSTNITGTTKPGQSGGTTVTEKASDEDTIKSYMKMFSDAFDDSPEDISRERFLQLAKFGANLLAQPGGDLTGAIGRAAAPSIEGLAASESARRAGDREVKLAAVKTAIQQMDDPTADKIKTLARIAGVPESEVANLMIGDEADSKNERIELTAKALEEEVGSRAALSIAQTLAEEGAVLAQASPIEIDKKTKKPKEGVADGYYYDDKGTVYKVEKGKPKIVKVK